MVHMKQIYRLSSLQNQLQDYLNYLVQVAKQLKYKARAWKISSDVAYTSGYVCVTLKCGNESKQANTNQVCPNKIIILKTNSFHKRNYLLYFTFAIEWICIYITTEIGRFLRCQAPEEILFQSTGQSLFLTWTWIFSY